MRACLLAPTRFRSLVIMGSSADEEDPLIRQQFSELRDVWTSEGMDGVVQKISFMAFGDALRGFLPGPMPL